MAMTRTPVGTWPMILQLSGDSKTGAGTMASKWVPDFTWKNHCWIRRIAHEAKVGFLEVIYDG
jgi:hypothetical protein